MSSSTKYPTEKHHRSGRRSHNAGQDDAEASLTGRHRSKSRSASRSRQETKAEEPELLKKESAAPKPKKDAKAREKFAKGFAALDLYPEAQRSCFVCDEKQLESNSYDMRCADRHWICVDCLKAGFEAYFKDFKNPPRCCGRPVDFHQAATTVFLKKKHSDFVKRGLQRMKDLSKMMADKKHNFHCAWPNCGTPLKEMGRSGEKKFGVCSKCKRRTCETCKSPWASGHSSEKCHNAGDEEVEALAKSLRLKSTICPHCDKPNVKTEGCNLVECPCLGLYCYVCGEKVNRGKPLCKHITSGR